MVFAHGSGSSRHSPRNRYVAEVLNQAGLATLLFDLLTPAEERNRANVFDIEAAGRPAGRRHRWLASQPDTASLPVGYFGASTGAGAALVAATDPSVKVAAVVSRGGPTGSRGTVRWRAVAAPTLLIVGGRDEVVLELNRRAQAAMPGAVRAHRGPRRHASLRGTGHAREGCGAGPRLVHRSLEPRCRQPVDRIKHDGDSASGHRSVPHTADLRIEAWAPTRDGCIRQAVLGAVESRTRAQGRAPYPVGSRQRVTTIQVCTGIRSPKPGVPGGILRLSALDGEDPDLAYGKGG